GATSAPASRASISRACSRSTWAAGSSSTSSSPGATRSARRRRPSLTWNPAATRAASSSFNGHSPVTGRILVVDDQRANSETWAGLLQARGYEVSTAPDGEAALAAVQRASPDLVVADIRMPGIDGYELCRRLREQPATALLPVILITSTEAHAER